MNLSKQDALDLAAQIEAAGYKIADKKIAVIRDVGEEVSKGGIVIPDTAQDVPLSGTVVMIGETILAKQKEMGLSALRLGQWVTFSKYHGAKHHFKLPSGPLMVEVMHAADIYIMLDSE